MLPAAGAQPAAAPSGSTATLAQAPAAPERRQRLIARVRVNTVDRGDALLLRGERGEFYVPRAQLAAWGIAAGDVRFVVIDGEPHAPLSAVPGLTVRFDEATVTLHLQAAAATLGETRIDLRPKRRADVIFTDDSSVFLNYGLNAVGDQDFGDRRYQAATEFGARFGPWLFYNTTDHTWGEGQASRNTRLLTNAQRDDRPNLRRLTVGDFFTPGFELAASVPIGGLSIAKDYGLDPYFVQYPTAAFRTEVPFPSTVQVRVDGNVVAQQQVQPGALDIGNIAGVTGAQNVTVVIRDPFGREQVLEQPFFFATRTGLAAGLHDYSYSVGWLRENYAIASNDYGDPAFAAFHRYAFTDTLTLGLRAEASRRLYNVGPLGTLQLPRLGILAAAVSFGGSEGRQGYAASAAWSYTGGGVTVGLGGRYLSPEYAQLADRVSSLRQRSSQYASLSFGGGTYGTLSATYYLSDTDAGLRIRTANVNYTLGLFGNRGMLSLGATHNFEPVSRTVVAASLRYYLDRRTSVVGSAGSGGGAHFAALSLQSEVPQGEGVGYTLTGGVADGEGYGRAFVQYNGRYAEAGAEYQRGVGDSRGYSRAFVAGSLGAIGGKIFASRPVFDSFALVRLPGLPGVPVHSNGWFVGRTDADGDAIATNLNAYYDNFITFRTTELPLDVVFPSAERVVSPPQRSGSVVVFEVRRMRAIVGVVVGEIDGAIAPLEFRELLLSRNGVTIAAFTARRGEFYVEGVEPGEYDLRLNGATPCTARLIVPEDAGSMTDVGRVRCVPVAP